MLIRQNRPGRRSAAAAVEMAVVMNVVMVPLLLGVWEMGRVVHVQQIVANAAREGARLAAQSSTFNSNGNPTYVVTNPDPSDPSVPNIKAAVLQTMIGAGLTNLTWDDVTVAFTFLDPPATTPPVSPQTEPWHGVKNQRFKVSVSIKFDDKVRWVNLGLVRPDTISFDVEWRTLVDDPFTVDTTQPTW